MPAQVNIAEISKFNPDGADEHEDGTHEASVEYTHVPSSHVKLP